MANFYVYEHWRTDRDECFYVGKGKGGRAYNMSWRNNYHKAIQQKIRKSGFSIEVRIYASGLEEDAAHKIEVERIAFWRSMNIELSNFTNGGEGVSGLVMSEEARAKMAAAKIGKKQSPEVVAKRIAPLIGRKQTADAIARSAEKRRGRKASAETRRKLSEAHKGKVVSKETREVLSRAHKGKPWSQARRDAHNRKKMQLELTDAPAR